MMSYNEEYEDKSNSKLKAKTIASAASWSSPEELKELVDKSKPKNIIWYKGNVYEIRSNELRNLGLDYYYDIINLCKEKGLSDPVFFGAACAYCSNADFNIDDIVMQAQYQEKIIAIPDTEKINWGCNYKGNENIKVVTALTSRDYKQPPFYAIKSERCAFEDSLISYLAENSYLEPFKTDREFNFRLITEYKEWEIPKEVLVENLFPEQFSDKKGELPAEPLTSPLEQPPKKKKLFFKIFNFFRK